MKKAFGKPGFVSVRFTLPTTSKEIGENMPPTTKASCFPPQEKFALVLFSRLPLYGQSKTRLAKGLGAQEAHVLAQACLEHASQEIFFAQKGLAEEKTSPMPCLHAFLFPKVEPKLQSKLLPKLLLKVYTLHLQRGKTLAEKMQQAFSLLFQQGYKGVLLAGSDIPLLEQKLWKNAFLALKDKDMVLGPSMDGGYYLLGLKKNFPALFSKKAQKSSQSLLEEGKKHHLSQELLPKLPDLDHAEDVEKILSHPLFANISATPLGKLLQKFRYSKV